MWRREVMHHKTDLSRLVGKQFKVTDASGYRFIVVIEDIEKAKSLISLPGFEDNAAMALDNIIMTVKSNARIENHLHVGTYDTLPGIRFII